MKVAEIKKPNGKVIKVEYNETKILSNGSSLVYINGSDGKIYTTHLLNVLLIEDDDEF